MSANTMERAAENAALVEAGYAAFAKGDMSAVEQAFDPECIWHAQRLVLRFFGQTMEMTQGTFRIEIKEVLGNDSGAAVVVRSSATRGERQLDDQQIHLLHLRNGRVIEVWQFVGDEPTVEAFWS